MGRLVRKATLMIIVVAFQVHIYLLWVNAPCESAGRHFVKTLPKVRSELYTAHCSQCSGPVLTVLTRTDTTLAAVTLDIIAVTLL